MRHFPLFCWILLVSFSIFSVTELLAMEGRKDIILVPVGQVNEEVFEKLRDHLGRVFDRKVFVGRGMPEPQYAFNKKRNQYFSSPILHALQEQKGYMASERVLGVVDHDLYVPELNFVFGEASRRVAVISITRLRQEFYGLPQDSSLFYKRVLTEAVHELGHTYGLGHCRNPRCVMFFSNSLTDTDRKGWEFCTRCKNRLGDLLR